jgi:hypothetical protein
MYSLTGTVTDSASGDPLPAAHVRIAATSHGTITGSAGQFALRVFTGTHIVVVSMIGYRPDTTIVVVAGNTVHDARLQSAEIVLPEMVVTSEDPAVEILRRAIANKRRWISRLVSYQMEAFTRQVIHRDTSIASVTESYTRGFWQQGDTLREEVLQRRQTANIPQSINFASVGRIINFNDDEIRFFGYTFVGPTSPDALDYYRVHLLRTRRDRGRDIYEIQLIPRSRTTPLFRGTVHIADESYALMGIDVEPNEAFLIPLVKEKQLRYRQQFALFADDIWLPVDIRINARASIGIIGLTIPPFGFEQTSVITDYLINPQLPDSLFRRPRLVVDSSAMHTDSSFWASHQVLPMSPEERLAYRSLDSTQSLDVQFKPGGVTMTIGGDAGIAGAIFEYADVAFNRVEGFHLGVQYSHSLFPALQTRAGIAYGFSDKSGTYDVGGTAFTSPEHTLGLSVDGYRRAETYPDAGAYGMLVNSLTALFNKDDYPDYYRVEGWRTSLSASPSRLVTTGITFIDELHSSLPVVTEFSLFSRSRAYRPNQPIAEGKMRSLVFFFRFGEAPVLLNLIHHDAIEFTLEYSAPDFAGSSFNFTRYEGTATFSLPTFGRSALFPPGFTFHIAAGTSRGALPLQRAFSPETASSGLAPFGVLKGMDVKEFSGTEYVVLNVEHNFRSLPFLALGIPFLYEKSIELITHGGFARTWNRSMLPLHETEGWYSEAGIGFNRVFDLLRVDFTRRFSGPAGFRFTLGIAQIL